MNCATIFVSFATNAYADSNRVQLPATNVPPGSCDAGGTSVDVRGFRGGPSVVAYARSELAHWHTSGTDDLLLALGEDGDTVWVLEATKARNDACDGDDNGCGRVVLREIGYNGRRRVHDLADQSNSNGDNPKDDPVAARLEAWSHERNNKLRPVSFHVNARPRASGGAHTDWALMIHDAARGKTYLWRRHARPVMCWCDFDWKLSTHLRDRASGAPA